MCTGKPKIHVTCYIAIFALLRWSRTEPAISLSYACMNIPYFVYPFIDGHLNCFYLLAIMNNDSTNMCIHISIQVAAFNSFGIYSELELLNFYF